MDEFIHWPKPHLLLSTTCDEMLSWIITVWQYYASNLILMRYLVHIFSYLDESHTESSSKPSCKWSKCKGLVTNFHTQRWLCKCCTLISSHVAMHFDTLDEPSSLEMVSCSWKERVFDLLHTVFSMFKIEALIWVSFWRALKFQRFSWRVGSNPRHQSKNIETKYKLIVNLCINYMVHVSSTMRRIKNQSSNSTSCNDNALRLLVLVAGMLYWGLQVTSSFWIWGCVLEGCFKRGIYLKGRIAFEGHWRLRFWTLSIFHLIIKTRNILNWLSWHRMQRSVPLLFFEMLSYY